MREGMPCDICGTEVPFSQATSAHAIEEGPGKVRWLCSSCRQRPGMTPADQCDSCREWKPRKGGRPVYATDAMGEDQEVLWLCQECAG